MPLATNRQPAFEVRREPDGATVIRSKRLLEPYPRTVCADLVRFAADCPQAVFLAERGSRGWTTIGYGQEFSRVRPIGARLLESRTSIKAPVAIVAGKASSTLSSRSQRCTSAFPSLCFRPDSQRW